MRIGLTYDLRDDYLAAGWSDDDTAEFDSLEVVAGLEGALQHLGHTTDRVGTVGALIGRLRESRSAPWDLVFNIAEGLSQTGIAREAQVPTVLDLFGVPYTFSDPLVCSLSLHKAMTKRVVRDAGVPTAAFAVVTSPDDIARVDLPVPLFAKPVAEGSSKGVTASSWVRRREDLAPVCETLLERYRQPVLVEEYLPGREMTVGIVGTGPLARCLGAMEVHLTDKADPGVYSFDNKEHWRERCRYSLADGPIRDEAYGVALAAYRALGCRDAGRVDVRADARGRLNFIEINPLAGLHPVKSDLPILARLAGMTYDDLIAEIVRSAATRVGERKPALPIPGLRAAPGPAR
ncbi:MAG: D-alanine--D-alanine ligase [Phycisphaerae bacterium]|nr:D-alanine--D-alanine ligase [Phycisphaerae bacterium]